MAIHGTSDVIIPEVISAEVATNAAFREVPLLRSGAILDLTNSKGEIYTDGGDTVTFLTREFASGVTTAGAYTKALVRDSKTGATGEKIKIDKYTESVTDKVVPIEYDYYTLADAAKKADVNAWLAQVVAQSQAETLQAALLAKANADGKNVVQRLSQSTKTLTVDAILAAKLAWGEKIHTMGPPMLFVHSQQYQDLASTSDFKTLASAATTALVEAYRAAGAVAMVHGVLIFLMDSVPSLPTGIAVSGITRSSQVATATTDVAHGLVVGDYITMSGATQTEYNGVFAVASVPTTTTFTYVVSGSPATPATGSPALTKTYTGIMLAPNSLGLLIKDMKTHPPHRYPGTSVEQVDVDYRFVTTRFRRKPVPATGLITH